MGMVKTIPSPLVGNFSLSIRNNLEKRDFFGKNPRL